MLTSTIDPLLRDHPLIVFAASQSKVDLLVFALAVVLLIYISFCLVSQRTTSKLIKALSKAVPRRFSAFRSFPLPPGPPSWPIFGYLRGLPKARAWEVYNEWSKTYGSDVIHVPTLTRHIIILNSAEAIFELLEQRGNIYSDRPHMVMLQDLMGLGKSTVFTPYGTNWRYHRKVYNQQMNAHSVRKFRHYQTAAAHDLVGLLLDSPQRFADHCRHFSARIVMNITYGYEIARENDGLVHFSETAGLAFSKAAQPGYYMVDTFPILRHVPSFLPFTHFKTIAAKTQELSYQTQTVPFRRVVQGMRTGSYKRCFVSDFLGKSENVENANAIAETSGPGAIDYHIIHDISSSDNFSYANLKSDKGMEEFEKKEDVNLIMTIAGGIFGAGTTTTTSAIQSFILAMILFPSVQRKAQMELDQTVEGRLPAFEDSPSLPYITALCREVLRWFPVTPTALPHTTSEEDVYKGYRIPKGCLLIPNARNLLHDPSMYPNPDEFRPERFLPDENGKILARDPADNGAFGFGRRICAGRNLAEASIWIAVASILVVFDISPAFDENGKSVDLTDALKGTPGLFNHPLPFKCRIEPRSERARQIIRDAAVVPEGS